MSQPNAKTEATLEISGLAYGPYGIGRAEGRVWMVSHTAPGDRIVARAVEESRRFSIGEVVRMVSNSPLRRSPPCPYAGRCGGCSWQHIEYAAQLRAKQQSVDDALRRIGKLTGYDLRPIIPAADEFHYRRRIRLQAGVGNQLGFYTAASHELLSIDDCAIAEEPVNRLLPGIRRWARSLNSPLDHVEIVAGDRDEEIVVAAKAGQDFAAPDELACADVVQDESGIAGLIVAGSDWRKVWGEPRITVDLSDLVLRVDADVFTQVNPAGNRRMLVEVLGAGNFQADDRVLELYCGAGNFTLPIARRVESAVAVEGHRHALANAKLNAQKNGIGNIRWICAPVPHAVAELKRKHERFSHIVLDPPRAGAKGIEKDLAPLGAARILYVSCNPTTLARDVAGLAKVGYKLRSAQPVDLFPQTFHVETLAVLER